MLFTKLRDDKISMGYLRERQFILGSFIICLLLLAPFKVKAQSKKASGTSNDSIGDAATRLVLIDNIFITGNNKTKAKIILRELSVETGKLYPINTLNEILEADRNKIYNTKLFNTVEVGLLELNLEKVDVVVKVTERWYISNPADRHYR